MSNFDLEELKLREQELDGSSLTRYKIRDLVEKYPSDIISDLIQIIDEMNCDSEYLPVISEELKVIRYILNKSKNLLLEDASFRAGDVNVVFDALRNKVFSPMCYTEMVAMEEEYPNSFAATLCVYIMNQLVVLMNEIGLERCSVGDVLARRKELLEVA